VIADQAIGDLLAWKDVQVDGLVSVPLPSAESLRPSR